MRTLISGIDNGAERSNAGLIGHAIEIGSEGFETGNVGAKLAAAVSSDRLTMHRYLQEFLANSTLPDLGQADADIRWPLLIRNGGFSAAQALLVRLHEVRH